MTNPIHSRLARATAVLGAFAGWFYAVGTAVAETGQLSAVEAAVKQNPLKDAYFGETHIHTGVSMDAFIGGNRLTPDDAYRSPRARRSRSTAARTRSSAHWISWR